MTTLSINTPQTEAELKAFAGFPDRVYEYRSARWKAPIDYHLSFLNGTNPFASGRHLRPFVALKAGEIVARVLAVADDRYRQQWQETLGHLCWFEALPNEPEAVQLLFDAACEWLAKRGLTAARVGYHSALLDNPFAADNYDTLPPSLVRQNPPYYHALLKEAGCELEKGFTDYIVAATPKAISHWQAAIDRVSSAGYNIRPLRAVPEADRAPQLAALFNETFASHWGWSAWSETEAAFFIQSLEPIGILDFVAFAYEENHPVGFISLFPEMSGGAFLAEGRVLDDREKLNALNVGVCDKARGRGLGLALTGYGFLELARRGATYLGYSLVRDDNYASRRVARKLGAQVRATYAAYRRNFSG